MNNAVCVKEDMKSLPQDIYTRLYDYVAGRDASQLAIYKDTFVTAATQNPRCIDVRVFDNMSADLCIDAIYWLILNAIPLTSETEKWRLLANSTTESNFRRVLIHSLASSKQARVLGVKFVSRGIGEIDMTNFSAGARRSLPRSEYYKLLVDICFFDKIFRKMYLFYVSFILPVLFRLHIKNPKR